jgi:hypothetical protein
MRIMLAAWMCGLSKTSMISTFNVLKEPCDFFVGTSGPIAGRGIMADIQL